MQINLLKALSNVDYNNRPTFFKHLSKEEFISLLTDWYANQETWKTIVENYNVSKIFYNHLAKVSFLTKESCPNCSNIIQGYFLPKKDILDLYKRNEITLGESSKLDFEIKKAICSKCSHSEPSSLCLCPYCLKLKEKSAEEKQKLIHKRYKKEQKALDRIDLSPTSTPADIDILFSVKEYIKFISWLRTYWDDDLDVIRPLNEYTIYEETLVDSNEIFEMIRDLYRKGIISPSPKSKHSAFSFEEKEGELQLESFQIEHVSYELLINFENGNISKIEFIRPNWDKYITMGFTLSEILDDEVACSMVEEPLNEILNLWKQNILEDAINYLVFRLKSVGLDFGIAKNQGKKTKALIQTILEKFSLGKVYALIFSAVKQASVFYLEKRVSKAHAANSSLKILEKYAVRAEIENWNLTSYSKPKELSSTFSYIFYEELLGLQDSGVNDIPSYEYIYNKFILKEND